MPKCRICDREDMTLFTVCYDGGEQMYICGCGAVNPLKKLPKITTVVHKHQNEWLLPAGKVTLAEVPLRTNWVGSHIDESGRSEW